MPNNTAFNRSLEELDIVIVEDSKAMQTVLRTILMPLRIDRIRAYDAADEALQAMMNEAPDLIISDWRMRPTSGYQMLKAIRQKSMATLCHVPLIFVTAHATRPLVEKAMRAGAHHLLAKPISPTRLHECITWITRDSREFIADEDGKVGIAGVVEAFNAQNDKMHLLNRARALHQHMEKRAGSLQSEIDKIMAEKSDPPVPMAVQKKAVDHGFAAIKRRHV